MITVDEVRAEVLRQTGGVADTATEQTLLAGAEFQLLIRPGEWPVEEVVRAWAAEPFRDVLTDDEIRAAAPVPLKPGHLYEIRNDMAWLETKHPDMPLLAMLEEAISYVLSEDE